MWVDARGRAYVGELGFDAEALLSALLAEHPAREDAVSHLVEKVRQFPGRIHLVQPDGSHRIADDATILPNGMTVSANGRYLYVNASLEPAVRRFAIAADGSLSASTVIARPALPPDGMSAVDAAAALQARGEAWPEGLGPDEASCRLWEAAGGGPLDIGALLTLVRAAGHPEAEAVAAAVGALAESGAALSAAQVVDLKVTLWRSSPSLWRTVRMPLAATLGDLHRVIQVLFSWDGDHLHAFAVAGVRYSDPFFDLEETADEEAVRLRDAFPAGARKPVRYEYDFGASWIHEITRAGSSRLTPGEAVPRCLSFSGDNPVEYWDEDEPVNPEPFDLVKVNAALADRF